jgi:hypothetical protein
MEATGKDDPNYNGRPKALTPLRPWKKLTRR